MVYQMATAKKVGAELPEDYDLLEETEETEKPEEKKSALYNRKGFWVVVGSAIGGIMVYYFVKEE